MLFAKSTLPRRDPRLTAAVWTRRSAPRTTALSVGRGVVLVDAADDHARRRLVALDQATCAGL